MIYFLLLYYRGFCGDFLGMERRFEKGLVLKLKGREEREGKGFLIVFLKDF